jgi:hypothetical protein
VVFSGKSFFFNKTDRQDITEILLKEALNTITLTDQELLEYDSVLDADMPSENEEDSEENIISEDEIE